MALTANRELGRYVDQELRSYLVAAATHIWKGALVGIERTTGYARNLVAGDLFAGVAYEEMDNSAGSGGDKSLRLYTEGDFLITVAGVSQAWVGAPVFAVDSESATVAAAPGQSYCGVLLGMVSATMGIVRILPTAAAQVEQMVIAPLVSSLSGATTNPVMVTQRAIKLISVQVSFNTVPNSGALDVGTDNADPDELIDAFNLSSLVANTPTSLSPVTRDVAKNVRIWAKVGQASSTAGVGGMLAVQFIELP